MDIIKTNQCFDTYPDKRDYDFNDFIKELVRGDSDGRPYTQLKVQDQGSSGACSRFGLTHLNNGQNIVEYWKQGQTYKQRDAMDIWNKSNKSLYLISALNQFKDLGLIEGWVVIKDRKIETIRKALSIGTYIYTGSNNWQRPSKFYNPYIIKRRNDGKIVGHAFCIVDDDPDSRCLRACNSYGPQWGDKGYFLIPYEFISDLFTLYAVVDKNDSDVFANIEKIEKSKQIIKLSKWLYENGDQEIKEYFKKIQITNKLETKYKFKYDL